jgi:hypothetical protein
MNKSEVFDNFLQIALEKGLVSKGEAEHTERNTKHPRWDSYDISAIEALYGVKPDAPKDMEYQHNIAEVAHPTPMVISPSHDKLNGLVENINERQNILMHIVYKQPEDGSTNQKRYPLNPRLIYPNTLGNKVAEQDLLMSLIRVANEMDMQDNSGLRVLADTCLNQLHSRAFKKEAVLPWLIGGAIMLALLYYKEHFSDVDQGLKDNYARLQSELQDFLTAHTTLGFGHQYDDTLKTQIVNFQSLLNQFWTSYSETMPLILDLEKPRSAQEVAQRAQTPTAQALVKAYQVLRQEAQDIFTELDKFQQNFNNPDFKAEHTERKGAFTSLLDSVPFLHGGKTSLFADDFDDVVNAIAPFEDSIKRLIAVLAAAGQKKDAIAEDLSTHVQQAKETLGPNPFDAGAPKAPPAPTGIKKTIQDLDQEAAGLGKELGDFF